MSAVSAIVVLLVVGTTTRNAGFLTLAFDKNILSVRTDIDTICIMQCMVIVKEIVL